MYELLRRQEEYLMKKLSHLLFEILECPQKKDILYLGLCYCQLTRVYNADEIPLEEIKSCLRKYLIDFDSYPWRDYLLELELFYLREDDERLIKGRGLFAVEPSEEASLSIDPRYGFLKHSFCQRIYKYWYISRKWDGGLHAVGGETIVKNANLLLKEGLYRESLHYLEDYLPYLQSPSELLIFRLLRQLALIGEAIEKRQFKEALTEVERTSVFLKEFSKELKVWPYDFKKLSKELTNLKGNLKRGKLLYLPPIGLEERRSESWIKRLLRPLKGLLFWR